MATQKPSVTALVLSYREGFSVNDASSISLTVAEQLSADNQGVCIFGGPNAIAAGAPLVEGVIYPLRLPWWPIGPHNRRYERAIRLQVKSQGITRLEFHNRGVLFHRLSDLPIGLALYLHNDPHMVGGVKTEAERLNILKRADYVACVSEYIRERFCEGMPEDLCDKVHVIFNTLNLDDFVHHEDKRKEILFVGRFIPEKGILPLAQALVRVLPEFPDWQARIIGSRYFGKNGAYHALGDELSKALAGARAQIDMPGYLPFSEIVRHFKQARIAVVPSTWAEPFGRTALEGMAAGCAVIASNRGGLPEVLGDAGILVEPTPDEIAHALRGLMSNASYCADVGARCAKRARTVFEPTVIHQKIKALRQSPSNWRG
ncbi:MAG: glycosyltransferase family 4 protein [Halothiobacillaceae bacterium]|nr:glycosyltransferase family 4 protein [Halothiobacillaceae bacterium]